MHGSVVKAAAARRIDPTERVFHPFLIVAIRKIFASLRTAALFAIFGRMHRRDRLAQQIVQFQGLDQIRVPDQRSIADLTSENEAKTSASFRLPSFKVSPVRNTAASLCIMRCMFKRISAVRREPLA